MAEAEGIVGEFFGLKAQSEADVLAMQCGDFYEFFGPDAELVERELDLNVSQKSSGGETYPMAGVPLSELTPYLQALVDRGYRVAIADQYETDNGHAREVTRIVTPGTFVETAADEAQYLASIVAVGDGAIGLAFADLSTGRFHVTRWVGDDALGRALSDCHRFDPVEVLPGPTLRDEERVLEHVRDRLDARVTLFDPDAFAPGRATHLVREQFGEGTLASLGLETSELAIVRAAGAIIAYVTETDESVLQAMSRLTTLNDSDRVDLDATTQRNLELSEPMTGQGTSVLETIDHTVTTPGRRQLREWLHRPRRSVAALDDRQAAVAALAEAAMARETLRDELADTADLARLANRAVRGSADARAVQTIARTLEVFPTIDRILADAPELSASPLVDTWEAFDRDRTDRLAATLEGAIQSDPPKTVQEGGIFRRGFDADLDELIDAHESALTWIEELEPREKQRHGITHLQVDRNRTDGYYIQVGRSETDEVPSAYREIKALKSSKRYTTDELEEHAREVMRLEAARADLEYELFCELRSEIAETAEPLQDAGRALGTLDALASLATHAVEHRWTRPTLRKPGTGIRIDGGRHPVVETTTEFVPNDTRLDEDDRFLFVTGPNMSGKSTYLRQTALVVLLAQIGSFVPAASAEIGLVDGIYTRVGALDELAHGRSTFMVEMQELSNILHSATEESLVILDEVGRGTATFDGMSIAWAATEYLHNRIRARTMFATHYHELTALAERLPGVRNVHVAVDERNGDVTFLRTVEPGPANRSYGIHVAELAGVPDPVTDRAAEVLQQLREDNPIEARGGESTEPVQAVFDVDAGEFRANAAPDGRANAELPPATVAVLSELSEIDIDEVRPIDLARMVAEWQDRVDTETP